MHECSASMDQLLGTAPDAEIAKRMGRPIKSVASRRLEKGIAAYGAPCPWSEEEEALLGKMDDKKFARKYHRVLSAVTRRRRKLGIKMSTPRRHLWTPADEKLLGVRPDRDVAMLIGATEKAVVQRRTRLGIPRSLSSIPRCISGRLKKTGCWAGWLTVKSRPN